jgi:hypothetical protein|tara:strand:+ start:168 stop:926 length:759 start_codon:yes stop_codon:yes gene_type:complete
MNQDTSTKKRDIISASEANVNHLSNVLDTNDFKALKELKEELKDTWHKKQVFRTETEMRMSVLQDAKYPTKAAKYWQCVREQNVFFENLMTLSFSYRKNEVEIKKLKKKIEQETDELEKELFEIELEEKLYSRANTELVAKDRMREIDQWSKLKIEYNDGSFDTKDVNVHQAESYKMMLTNKVKTLTPGSSQSEVFNVVGQLQTLERLEQEGVLLPYSDEAKTKLGYKTNTQKSEDLDMSISNNMSTKSTGI